MPAETALWAARAACSSGVLERALLCCSGFFSAELQAALRLPQAEEVAAANPRGRPALQAVQERRRCCPSMPAVLLALPLLRTAARVVVVLS